MTTRQIKVLALVALASMTLAASLAQAGPGEGGGGDLQCDARIKEVTTNLREWFQGSGPEKNSALDLSSTLNPATGRPYTKSEYTEAMAAVIAMPLRSACVHRSHTNAGAPVKVGQSPKICRTSVKGGVVEMICDSDVFLNMSGDGLQNQDLQIQQIHHEFAINVPGLEPDTASLPKLKPSTIDISSYRISRQLAKVTQTTEVRKVVVMDPAQSNVSGRDSKIMVDLNAAACNLMMAKSRKMNGEDGSTNIQAACYQIGLLAQNLSSAQSNSISSAALVCQGFREYLDKSIKDILVLSDSVSSPEAMANKYWYFGSCR